MNEVKVSLSVTEGFNVKSTDKEYSEKRYAKYDKAGEKYTIKYKCIF